MLISSGIARMAAEQYNKERYGPNAEDCYSFLIIAIVIIIIELSMLYFAIKIAIVSGKNSAGKFVHVILAIFLTMPYLLLNMIFNEKAQNAVSF